MFTLKGRLTGETGACLHLLPITKHTMTNLPVRQWFGRILHYLVEVHKRILGWVFQMRSKWGKVADYDNMFVKYSLHLQKRNPILFVEGTDLTKDLSLWRSERCGSNAEAIN